MGNGSHYKKGSWNAICDRCGFQFKSSELRKTWEGYWVDAKCFETRQPQDFVRGIPDPQAVPWDRPRAQLSFIPPGLVLRPLLDTNGIPILDKNGVVIFDVYRPPLPIFDRSLIPLPILDTYSQVLTDVPL